MSTKEHLEDSSEEMSASLPPLKWSKEVFDCLVKNFKFPDSWGVRYQMTVRRRPTLWQVISLYSGIILLMIRHFEFLCRLMHIDPTVNRFKVFYQFHYSQGFYSFAQRSSVKKILLNPPKSFHEWNPKFFFIKAGVIPMKMTFRGTESILVENMKTPESEIWYQDLKDIPSIELPERALVTAGISLHWKMDREDKLVYMEDDKSELTNLGIGPEKKKKRVPVVTIAPKKTDAPKAQSSKAKNVREEKKGTRRFSYSWCDYIVVTDTSEGLAPVVLRKSKAEPWDTEDIPASNPDDPIDLESSPEPLLRTKVVKRNHIEVEAAAQPAKKVPKRKIGKRGNLDAFITKPPPEVEKHVEVELEAEKIMENVGVSQPKSPEVVVRDPEKGKSIPEDPVITIPFSATTSAPVNVERSPTGDQGFFAHDEEDSPICPEETLGDYYYYRSYSEKKASEIHAPVWKLKKCDTFSDWQVCRDWLQGTFPPAEVNC
ncbi:hypothetical protein Hanom_Chr15g01408611 [Helianthus anomalus]